MKTFESRGLIFQIKKLNTQYYLLNTKKTTMAKINFGGTEENVVTREEFPVEKAREVLKNETIAVLGYGVQGPGQALNLRDNGMNVIVGQRKGSSTWDKAVADGWVPGKTLFELEEACEKGTILQFLLSDDLSLVLFDLDTKVL